MIYVLLREQMAELHWPVSGAGVKDVVPMATEDGYEGFEEMIERTNTWLKDQCDILVVNMQSIMVQKDEDGA